MTETRYIRQFDSEGNETPISYEVSDEQLAAEQERAQAQQILDILDEDWTATEAVSYLKKVIRRLVNKGILP